MERTPLPVNLGETILLMKHAGAKSSPYRRGVVQVGPGVEVLINERYGLDSGPAGIQIRKTTRSGPRMPNTIAQALHKCAGKRGKEFLDCIEAIDGFRAPARMKATKGEKYKAKAKEILERGFYLPEREAILREMAG